MQSFLFRSVLVLALGLCAPAVAQTRPTAATQAPATPDAATAFAERSALLQAMQRCPLLSPDELTALTAGTAQARGALLRGGWSSARVAGLEGRAQSAGANRPCHDPALRQAAGQARAGYAAWSRLAAMQFPGSVSQWSATRAPDAEGWYLRQNGRAGSVLGVRQGEEEEATITFTAPLLSTSPAPTFAVMSFRDGARAPLSLAEVPARSGTGLARLAAPLGMARQVFAQSRTIETDAEGRRVATLTFPANAFEGVVHLDPREAIEVRLGRSGTDQSVSVYFEVGDLAAAQAFLAARPPPPPPPAARPTS